MWRRWQSLSSSKEHGRSKDEESGLSQEVAAALRVRKKEVIGYIKAHKEESCRLQIVSVSDP